MGEDVKWDEEVWEKEEAEHRKYEEDNEEEEENNEEKGENQDEPGHFSRKQLRTHLSHLVQPLLGDYGYPSLAPPAGGCCLWLSSCLPPSPPDELAAPCRSMSRASRLVLSAQTRPGHLHYLRAC